MGRNDDGTEQAASQREQMDPLDRRQTVTIPLAGWQSLI